MSYPYNTQTQSMTHATRVRGHAVGQTSLSYYQLTVQTSTEQLIYISIAIYRKTSYTTEEVQWALVATSGPPTSSGVADIYRIIDGRPDVQHAVSLLQSNTFIGCIIISAAVADVQLEHIARVAIPFLHSQRSSNQMVMSLLYHFIHSGNPILNISENDIVSRESFRTDGEFYRRIVALGMKIFRMKLSRPRNMPVIVLLTGEERFN